MEGIQKKCKHKKNPKKLKVTFSSLFFQFAWGKT
jgi:hypothetical protein